MNNRPDLLAETSLARAFKVYLEKEVTPKVKITPPKISIIVEPSVILYLFRSKNIDQLLSLLC